jgi:2,3-bisphosphoglycerate-independent phosphoglycerate mutase
VKRIEEIDEGFFSTLMRKHLDEECVVCVTCDHSTPWREKGHSDDPVPVLIAGHSIANDTSERFTEASSRMGGLGMFERGSLILPRLVESAR